MKKYVLIISTAEDGEHRGFVGYELQAQLNLIVSETINRRLGNQHFHTVTVKHDGLEPGVSVYTFDEWMHAIQMATEEAREVVTA